MQWTTIPYLHRVLQLEASAALPQQTAKQILHLESGTDSLHGSKAKEPGRLPQTIVVEYNVVIVRIRTTDSGPSNLAKPDDDVSLRRMYPENIASS